MRRYQSGLAVRVTGSESVAAVTWFATSTVVSTDGLGNPAQRAERCPEERLDAPSPRRHWCSAD